MVSDEEIRLTYGANALVTRAGRFTFVHLDRPSLRLARERTRRFDPNAYFIDDCPLCQLARSDGGVIVFDDDDGREEDDEEILME